MQTFTTAAPRFQPASDQSLLVHLDQKISLGGHQRVGKLLRLLELEPIAGVRNLNPAYCSILVSFDAPKLKHGNLEEILLGYLDRLIPGMVATSFREQGSLMATL